MVLTCIDPAAHGREFIVGVRVKPTQEYEGEIRCPHALLILAGRPEQIYVHSHNLQTTTGGC